MKRQRAEVLEQVRKHGWDAVVPEYPPLEWWADEMLQLESRWSPVGARAYLTFLVDPQFPDLGGRKRGAGVWAVKLSAAPPAGWLTEAGEFTLDFGHGWQEQQLPAFLEHLTRLRNSSAE